MIDSYEFGKITVNRKTYYSDVIIYPEQVDDSWWRKQGHNLCIEDLRKVLDYEPEILIIGKGKPGLMKVPETIRIALKESGIEVYVSSTEEAVSKYNKISSKYKTVAALHISC